MWVLATWFGAGDTPSVCRHDDYGDAAGTRCRRHILGRGPRRGRVRQPAGGRDRGGGEQRHAGQGRPRLLPVRALATYGKQYIEGFKAGLAYATSGTNKVGDRPIEVTEADDAGDPAKARLRGEGPDRQGRQDPRRLDRLRAWRCRSRRSPRRTRCCSSPARPPPTASPASTSYTFRSGRQSYQDVLDREVVHRRRRPARRSSVFAQDSAFGKANEAAVTAVIGGAGATVEQRRWCRPAPPTSPRSPARSRPPSRTCSSSPGPAPPPPAMWQALDQQGVLAATTVVTGLDIRASWPTFGAAGDEDLVPVALLRRAPATPTPPRPPSREDRRRHARPVPPGRLHRGADGGARGRARAATTSTKMITALEGWSFDGVKGKMTVRAEDHALLQPMFQVKLGGTGAGATAAAGQGARRRRTSHRPPWR